MADFSALKQSIQNYIKQNGNKEITGAILQNILLSMVTTMGDGAINDNASDISDIKGDIQNINGDITNINSSITDINGDITDINGDITELNGNLSNEVNRAKGAETTTLLFSDGKLVFKNAAGTVLYQLSVDSFLSAITTRLNTGALYAGYATPSTTPATLTSQEVFYLATQAGTYTNFHFNGGDDPIVLTKDGIYFIVSGDDDDDWNAEPMLQLDDVPTAGSDNPVKSGGVAEELALGAVYDVSAKNPTAGHNNDGKWESLSALLSDANLNTLIPTSVRKGGMSVKFVSSVDNKYIQFRLMEQNFTTNVVKWQGVDEVPKIGSQNFVKSGGIGKKGVVGFLSSGIEITSTSFTIKAGTLTLTYGGRIEYQHTFESDVVINQNVIGLTGSVLLNASTHEISFSNFGTTPDEGYYILLTRQWQIGWYGGALYDFFVSKNVIENISTLYRGTMTVPDGAGTFSMTSAVLEIRKQGKAIYSVTIPAFTYTIEDGKNYAVVFNTLTSAVEGVLITAVNENHLILLRRDYVKGWIGGLLYNDYVSQKLEKCSLNIENSVFATYSGSIKVNANSIDFGAGELAVFAHDKLIYTHDYDSAFTVNITGTGCIICYKSNGNFGFSTRNTLRGLDFDLLYYQYGKGIVGGLLFGQVNVLQENKYLVANYRGVLTATSTAFNLSAGLLEVYNRDNVALFSGNISAFSAEVWYGTTKTIVLDLSDNTVKAEVSVGSLTPNKLILMFWDAYNGWVGGLLYDYYLKGITNSLSSRIDAIDVVHENPHIIEIGHGANLSYPSNSIGLEKVYYNSNFKNVEFDIRPCSDGFVLAHDNNIYLEALKPNGDVISQSEGLVLSGMTVAEAQTYKTGILYGHPEQGIVSGYENATFVTLDAMLKVCKAFGFEVWGEIKTNPYTITSAQVDGILSIFKNNAMLDNSHFLIWDGGLDVVRMFLSKGIYKFVYTQASWSTQTVDDILDILDDLSIDVKDTDIYIQSGDLASFTSVIGEYIHSKGFKCSCYGINDSTADSMIATLFENGMDAFITDGRHVTGTVANIYMT